MARSLRTLWLAALIASLLVAAAPAPATVPPTDCGISKVSGKRYQIKTHQVTCKRAERWSRTYLRSGRKPSGYRCRNYSAQVTKFRFMCRRGARDFFAIRR